MRNQKHIELNITLHKNLNDGEELCPTCKGFGVIIKNYINNQSLAFCDTCYNGVVKRCHLCNKIIPKYKSKCNCEQQREIDRIERKKRLAAELSLAPEATPDILKKSAYFYSDDYGVNDGYFDEWDDFFDYWYDAHFDSDDNPENRPKYVWTTEPVDLKLWARDIVSAATEDLYEDAYDSISSKKLDELQKYLDKWCVISGCGTTYYQGDYKVKIPWEYYDKYIEDYYGRE